MRAITKLFILKHHAAFEAMSVVDAAGRAAEENESVDLRTLSVSMMA